jgi:hypothetical protein
MDLVATPRPAFTRQRFTQPRGTDISVRVVLWPSARHGNAGHTEEMERQDYADRVSAWSEARTTEETLRVQHGNVHFVDEWTYFLPFRCLGRSTPEKSSDDAQQNEMERRGYADRVSSSRTRLLESIRGSRMPAHISRRREAL